MESTTLDKIVKDETGNLVIDINAQSYFVNDLPAELKPQKWRAETITGSELEDTLKRSGYCTAKELTDRLHLSQKTVTKDIRDKMLSVVRVANNGHSYFLLSPQIQEEIKNNLDGKRIDYDYVISNIDPEKKYTVHELATQLARTKKDKQRWLLTVRRLIEFGLPYFVKDSKKIINGSEAIAFLQKWKNVYSKSRLAARLGYDLRIINKIFDDQNAIDSLLDSGIIELYPLVHRDKTQYYVPEDKLKDLHGWIESRRLNHVGAKGKYVGELLFEFIEQWRNNLNGDPFTVVGLNKRFPGTRSAIRHRFLTFEDALAATDRYAERRDFRKEGFEPIYPIIRRASYKIFRFFEGSIRNVNTRFIDRITKLDRNPGNRLLQQAKTGIYYRSSDLARVQSLIEAAAIKEFGISLEIEGNSINVINVYRNVYRQN